MSQQSSDEIDNQLSLDNIGNQLSLDEIGNQYIENYKLGKGKEYKGCDKTNLGKGFTKKYECHKLVYFEHYSDVKCAIVREKQIKKWRREKKEALIKIINPKWKDLYYDLVA